MALAPLTVQQVWLKKRAVLAFVLKKENSTYFKGGNNWINLPVMLFPRRKLSYTVVTSGYCRSIISVVSAHLRAPSVPCDNWSGDSEQTSLPVNVSLSYGHLYDISKVVFYWNQPFLGGWGWVFSCSVGKFLVGLVLFGTSTKSTKTFGWSG